MLWHGKELKKRKKKKNVSHRCVPVVAQKYIFSLQDLQWLLYIHTKLPTLMSYVDYTAQIFLPSLNLFVSRNQEGMHKGFQVGVGAGQKHGLCEYNMNIICPSLHKIVTESFLYFIFLSICVCVYNVISEYYKWFCSIMSLPTLSTENFIELKSLIMIY